MQHTKFRRNRPNHINKFSFPWYMRAYIHNLNKMAHWLLRKASFNFDMKMNRDQGQEMTLTLYTHIHSVTQ